MTPEDALSEMREWDSNTIHMWADALDSGLHERDEKIRRLIETLDSQIGTPCEQIRHQQTTAQLLGALEAIVESLANADEEGLIEHAQQMIDARAAIAKARGHVGPFAEIDRNDADKPTASNELSDGPLAPTEGSPREHPDSAQIDPGVMPELLSACEGLLFALLDDCRDTDRWGVLMDAAAAAITKARGAA